MSTSTNGRNQSRSPFDGRGTRALHAPSKGRIVGAEALVALACVGGVAGGLPPTAILTAAVIATLALFVEFGRRPVFEWVPTLVRFAADRGPKVGTTVTHIDSTGRGIGLHWNGSRVTCLVEFVPPIGSVTLLGRARADVAQSIPLAALATCLSQHDIRLFGLDVVSLGTRSASGITATEVYERLIGPLPAVSSRSVWIAVSLDVSDNSAAVRSRGGGRIGASRTIAIATERVVRVVRAAGLDAYVLSAEEFDAAAARVTRGVPVARLTQTWRYAPLPGVENTGYGIDCSRLRSDTLAELWAVPTVSTSIALSIRPGRTSDEVRVAGSCRYTTRTTLPPVRLPGLVSMRGRHRDALAAQLPYSDPSLDRLETGRAVAVAQFDSLRLPIAGCGQLLGSDDDGNGVAVRIYGHSVGTVLIAGELYLAQQLMFRAIAVGARIMIRTDRPHAWRPLVDSVASPAHMVIDGGPLRPDGRYDVMLVDYADAFSADATPPGTGITLVTLTEHLSRAPIPDPDLTIVQPGASGDRIRLRSRAGECELILVTIPQETAFIGRPRSVRATTPA